MQLQAERDHFVHAGVGGGSSSSSPSCSPPKGSPLLSVKVKNLKKPRSKPKDRDREKAPRKDLGRDKAVIISKVAPNAEAVEEIVRPSNDLDAAGSGLSAIVSIMRESLILTPTEQNRASPNSSIAAAATPAVAITSETSIAAPTTITAAAAVKKNHHSHTQDHPGGPVLNSTRRQQTTTAGTVAHPQRSLPPWAITGDKPSPTVIQTSASERSVSPLQCVWVEQCPSLIEPASSACVSQAFGSAFDRLSLLPPELLFHVLCLLDALDLSRMAQVNRFCARIVGDNGIWRIKSIQHPLFTAKHIQGRCRAIRWLTYYKFLHQKSLTVKRNWANAMPQAVHVLEGHTSLVSSLKMSMWTLVTASTDSTLRVWDLRTMQCIRVLYSRQSLNCVSQSESASAVCARTSFGGLCIWDTRTGELILQDDTAMPQIASFMYMDECYIGYGQSDGSITVFDWSSRTTLEVIGSYQAHEGDVIHISILDRKYVISASTNGETLVYSLKSSCVVERILLPYATQAIQFTPTIHGDKVMFSTRDAVYEYELLLDHLTSKHEQAQLCRTTEMPANTPGRTAPGKHKGKHNHVQLTGSQFVTPDPWRSSHITSEGTTSTKGAAAVSLRPPVSMTPRATPTSGRVWKNSNSLLSQIRQRVGSMGRAFNQERLIIPTRFPRLTSIYCLPRTCRSLDHGTTSARDSYGVFMPNHCTRLHEMSVYTRATKQIKQIHGPAVDAVLTEAIRNRFYTTMECNQHCAVVSSGNKVYVISFLPPDV